MNSTNNLLKDDSGVILLSDVMVPMRDGVLLATDIYMPADRGDAALPVILERTPYGKRLPSRSECNAIDPRAKSRAEIAAYFVRHGYIVIYQDCRGRYQSQGSFVKYTSDGEDGYDTCAWIVDQPWSNGRIGTKGLSYAAHTQVALASLGAPGVVAMFVDSGGFANAYQGGIRQGGAFELKQATWALRQALESQAVQNDPATLAALNTIDMRDWLGRIDEWTTGHSPLALVPEYESFLFDQWRRGVFDDYWRQAGLYAEGHHPKFCDAAMVHMSSWYDPYARTAAANYMGLSARKRGPVRLILGPWTHGNRSLTYAGDVDFGAQATLDGHLAEDFLALRLRWFERWLKDDAGAAAALAPVTIFVMGGGSGKRNAAGRLEHGGVWRREQDWPLPGARDRAYYLHADGALSPQAPHQDSAALSYRYDPRHPMPTVGGAVTSGEPLMVGGAFDQREGPQVFGVQPPYRALSERDDVLVFQTAPLEHDLEVTGEIVAHLWVASDCVDTDFTFKLIDVYPPSDDYPDGYAMNLCDGILRARYRDSWSAPAMMTPGETYRLRIDGFPTSNLFQRGHRIRIDISSSNFPHFDSNPNTGAAEGMPGPTRVASNRVFVDRERPSHVVLPLIPPRAAQGDRHD